MFTSLLRRIIDVRFVPLATALLLSGCALHRPDADEPVTLPHIELPNIDIPVPDITVPDVELSEPTTPPTAQLRFEAATAGLVAFMHTCAELQTRDKEPMPMEPPATHRVLQREAEAAQPIARGPAGSALTPLVTPRDAEWRRGLASAAKTTSLMSFLCNEPS